MIREIYFCDCCGKKFDPKEQKYLVCSYNAVDLRKFNKLYANYHKYGGEVLYSGDLCTECLCQMLHGLAEQIEKLVAENAKLYER